MIKAIEENLNKGIKLLQNISDEQYNNTTIAPYYSSIGGHIRHILDVFDCIFEGFPLNDINLINRKRNELVEKHTSNGIMYFDDIIKRLLKYKKEDLEKIVKVTDDLGLGIVSVNYTFGGILTQAHSHAIHHFSSIGYLISQLGIQLPDQNFGFNPTTPKKINK